MELLSAEKRLGLRVGELVGSKEGLADGGGGWDLPPSPVYGGFPAHEVSSLSSAHLCSSTAADPSNTHPTAISPPYSPSSISNSTSITGIPLPPPALVTDALHRSSSISERRSRKAEARARASEEKAEREKERRAQGPEMRYYPKMSSPLARSSGGAMFL
ncbi:hypothetical protein IAT38_008320 [Cryptococcus sp. DSM 104549]